MPKDFARYAPGNKLSSRLLMDRISLSENSASLDTLLAENPKTVTVINHGPLMGGLTGLVGLADLFLRFGGESRVPLGVTWRGFYQLPVFRHAIRYLTQSDRALNLEELAERFLSGGFTDVVIMPEGDNCNFGPSDGIKPFVSPRFVELAMTIEAPVLIAVQKGGEEWALDLPMPKEALPWLGRILPKTSYECLQETGRISLPYLLSGRLKQLTMCFELYSPSLSQAELSDRPTVRRGQLTQEANRVRERMISMLDEMSSK